MSFSVNTNPSALAALRTLNKTSSQLAVVQNRVNTGLKVASAKDNAAVYNIAQNLRATLGGLNASKSSLDRAISTVDVAISAAEAVSDILIEMREKSVAASDVGLDTASRTALASEFTELKASITSIVTNAEFNGKNLLTTSQVSAIVSEDGTAVIAIAAQDSTLTTLAIIASTLGDTAGAVAAVVSIDAAINTVGSSLATLGSGAKRMELQRGFADKLTDAVEIGIGNLVDADLAKESATLQALQVKQQLGLQALSIANQAPQAVLTLFQ